MRTSWRSPKQWGRRKPRPNWCPLLKVKFVYAELTDGDEEFLVILAKQIKHLAFFLGPDSVKSFIPIIQSLFASEDTSVRENVVFQAHPDAGQLPADLQGAELQR